MNNKDVLNQAQETIDNTKEKLVNCLEKKYIKTTNYSPNTKIYSTHDSEVTCGTLRGAGIKEGAELYELMSKNGRVCLGLSDSPLSAIAWVDKAKDIFITQFIDITCKTFDGEEIKFNEATVERVFNIRQGVVIGISSITELPEHISNITLNKFGHADTNEKNQEIRYETYENITINSKLMIYNNKFSCYEYKYEFLSKI